MAQYLQRVYIDPEQPLLIDQPSQYGQRVYIEEILNADGTPWVPTPQYDELSVVTKTTTSGTTVLGSDLTGTVAVYSGGKAPVVVEYQWQRADEETGPWQGVQAWTTPEDATEVGLTYTTTAADEDHFIRFASRATDDNDDRVYGSGNSIGPMTRTPIVVTEPTIMTNGTFSNPTNAYLHETLTMYPAVMTGGFGTITYQYRLQSMDAGTDTWANLTGWVSDIITHEVDQSDEGDKLRFQTKGTDDIDTTKTSNSGVTTVAVSTLIGDLTVNPPGPMSLDPGELVGFTVSNTGDADPMFIWAIRSGPATITSMYNFGPTAEVTINADASTGDTVQVQVTADDPSATDTPQSTVVTIVVN